MSITVTVDNDAYLAAVAVKAAEQNSTPEVVNEDGRLTIFLPLHHKSAHS